MQITLTNTLTRRKEPFAPADPSRVTMYVCGPTVYNVAHIGNARPPVVFDTLFRLLRHVYGEKAVIYARNYTDIDDKIITASIERGVPIEAITRDVERIYEEDMGALNVLTADAASARDRKRPGDGRCDREADRQGRGLCCAERRLFFCRRRR